MPDIFPNLQRLSEGEEKNVQSTLEYVKKHLANDKTVRVMSGYWAGRMQVLVLVPHRQLNLYNQRLKKALNATQCKVPVIAIENFDRVKEQDETWYSRWFW